MGAKMFLMRCFSNSSISAATTAAVPLRLDAFIFVLINANDLKKSENSSLL